MPNKKIKVLIADDHAVVRQSLAILLDTFDDFQVIATADSGRMAMTMCHHHKPDVVLLDLIMPDTSGVSAVQEIIKTYAKTKIIILSSTTDNVLIRDALRAGAIGFISKTGPIDEVAVALRQVTEGQTYLDTKGVQALISTPTQAPAYRLTRRQKEILSLMVQGLTNAEIAQRLTVTVSTVKNHIVLLFDKLNVKSRTEAVGIAVKNNILEDASLMNDC